MHAPAALSMQMLQVWLHSMIFNVQCIATPSNTLFLPLLSLQEKQREISVTHCSKKRYLVLRPSWEKNPCVTLFVVIRQRGVSSEDLLGDELQALVFLTEVAERLSGLGHCPELTVSALQIL